MDQTPPDKLDADPELVVEAAYIQAFKRLSRKLTAVAAAVVIETGVLGFVVGDVIVSGHRGHLDTQHQIRTLVCLVIDNAPPDHGLADKLRKEYMCGPYVPSKAVFAPKKPVPSTQHTPR